MKDNFDKQNNSDMKFFALLTCGLVVFFLGSFFVSLAAGSREVPAPAEPVASPFDQVEVEAEAAYVYDARTHTVLYAKNEDKRLPLASLTKVMSALVASEIAPLGSTVVVSREALSEEGDSGLYADERWLLGDLLDFALTSSSNDGIQAAALSLGAIKRTEATPEEAEADFVLKMNEMANTLNMKNTYYGNVTGLDESDVKGGAYGTARDMVVLLDHVLLYKPELLEATKEQEITVSSLDNLIHTAGNTSYIVTDIPGIKASKTGYTDVAGGNLVVAFDPEVGRPIIISVLGSTSEGRFEDVITLMEASMEYIRN